MAAFCPGVAQCIIPVKQEAVRQWECSRMKLMWLSLEHSHGTGAGERRRYKGFVYNTRCWTQTHCMHHVFIVVLYLWGSSCGVDDGSPKYWLSLDKDHLHSAIPMFSTKLGFSSQIHHTAVQPGVRGTFGPEREKGIRTGLVTNRQTGQSDTMGWNLKRGSVSDDNNSFSICCCSDQHWSNVVERFQAFEPYCFTFGKI